MASTEQPLKKRKLSEPLLPPPPPLPPQPPPPQYLQQSSVDRPLAPEEILKRRRNKEEIRTLYDCYKRIKYCLSQKDGPRLMPDMEQAYLSIITASRGCTSVQRIVVDLIPRYASYCPTALEAAAKVIINMHNWSLAAINRGEDADGVLFRTAKACIVGLADICRTASSEAPTSSVISGICSAVFLNVFKFLVSTFEGESVFQIVDKETIRMQYSAQFFSELEQKFSDEDESQLLKLSKFRVLCLLKIFLCCPRNSLAACFELFESTAMEGSYKEGFYILSQVTSKLDGHDLDNTINEPKSSTTGGDKGDNVSSEVQVSKGNLALGDASTILMNCLLGLAIAKDPSLTRWIVSKYKKLRMSSSSEVISEVTSVLEGVFESFTELVKLEDHQVDSDEDDLNPSQYVHIKYLTPRSTRQHETTFKVSGGDSNSRVNDRSCNDDVMGKFSGQSLKPQCSLVHLETDLSNASPRDLFNNQMPSRKLSDYRSFECRNYFNQIEKNQISNLDLTMRSSSGGVWYADGDLGSMNIFPASKQLWLGCLGPDASETHVRFRFEKFGPIDRFLHFPFKGFALVEYRYILDAVKAREIMNGQSPWGDCLRVKFLDQGLGTRGTVNGVAVGSSCFVYVGNVSSQWAKDEIIHESMKVVYKGPHMVTDLIGEGALLLEFETPEEAAAVIAHVRYNRTEKTHPLPSIHAEFIKNEGGNSIVEYRNSEVQLHSVQGNISGTPPPPPQPPILPPPLPFQSSPFIQPVYFPPNRCWDAHGLSHHLPFLPASVTPLSQMQGSSQHSTQLFPLPVASLPPPLPQSQPPLVPPPPSSPPPPPAVESSNLATSVQHLCNQWQGTLGKSGVHYCSIYAVRVDSDVCKYLNAMAEPADWPAKLDMNKRTDFQHVNSTFSGTPSHKREVCLLFPLSESDRTGFQNFVSYLRQRECAGVIKIPASKSMWTRLLFILPHSVQSCDMLSIEHNPSDGLIALILAKETSSVVA